MGAGAGRGMHRPGAKDEATPGSPRSLGLAGEVWVSQVWLPAGTWTSLPVSVPVFSSVSDPA